MEFYNTIIFHSRSIFQKEINGEEIFKILQIIIEKLKNKNLEKFKTKQISKITVIQSSIEFYNTLIQHVSIILLNLEKKLNRSTDTFFLNFTCIIT